MDCFDDRLGLKDEREEVGNVDGESSTIYLGILT
jgi:hypothetical protein